MVRTVMILNDNSKPLIFLGSNSALWFISDICRRHNIKVHGIIDSDYFGNKAHLDNIPVIDSELVFENPTTLQYYHNLNCISLVDKTSVVHETNIIGKNVLIDSFCCVSAYNTIGDFTSIYAYAAIGHHNVIGRNCIIQRQSGVHMSNILEENVYVGLSTQVFGDHLTLKKGTIVHPCLAVNRSTKENETVSLAGKDLSRIYPVIQPG